MTTTARVARALTVGVLLAAATLATGWGLLFFAPLPTIDGYYRLLGLNARAEVVRDVRGMAHVYAADAHDLFFLQGYVTAQDRLVQLERLRREAHVRRPDAPAGPVAGALGAALEAYAAGVTKLVAQYDEAGVLPGELVLAGVRPAPWTSDDSLAIAAAFMSGAGSRCMGASGTLTAKGGPLLAADLAFDGPPPGLYEVGLEVADARAVGISLPGVPGLIAGHNGSVAWAVLSAEGAAPTAVLNALLDWQLAPMIDEAFLAPLGLRIVQACAADRRTIANAAPPAGLSAGSDVETMRLLLGRPAAEVGARLVVDLADPETSRAALSHGVSGLRLSSHHEDQRAIWEIGQLHALPLSRAAIGETDGELVLRSR